MYFITYEDQPGKVVKFYSKTGKWAVDLKDKKVLELFQSNTLTTQDFLSTQYSIIKEDMIEKLVN